MVDRRDRRVLLGRVVGVHGVRGGVKVESFTEPRDRILDYQPWILRQHGVETVLRAKAIMRHPKVAVALEGVDERDAAAALMGAEICVRRAQLPKPADGGVYWTDLEDMAVSTVDGVALGRVDHLFATGANDVLVVRQDRRERLIPFVRDDVVKRIDFDNGQIVVDWDPDF